jgi:hypothetical protein
MAELEPGNPDELVRTLRNWLRQANDPSGELPPGMDPTEWAVRRFIAGWIEPVRIVVRGIEESIRSAEQALADGDYQAVADELNGIRQEIGEGLRTELGIYSWDEP